MKIRTGFVSNSSSSSFCIFGVRTTLDVLGDRIADKPDLVEKVKEYDPEFFSDCEDDVREVIGNCDDISELIGSLFDDSTNIEVICNSESASIYIGRSYTSIGGEETGNQFKQSVRDDLFRSWVQMHSLELLSKSFTIKGGKNED